MRHLALIVFIVTAGCSGSGGGSQADCSSECSTLVETCPSKVTSSACLSSCQASSDFVWAAKGTSGDTCAVLYMGERADVPCGVFASLPCVEGDDQPDARPGTPDARPGAPDARPGAPDARPGAPDGSPTGPDAGGSPTFERCPIEKSALKVTFPYVSVSPPTVVDLGGSCYRQQNGNVSEGYNSASAINAVTDATGSVAIADVANAHVLFEIRFLLDEQPLSSSQVADLAAKTGIAADKITTNDGRLVGTFSGKPATVNYTLPSGVSLASFMPSSSSEKGFVTFSASSANLTQLQQVLSDFGGGISVTVPLQKYSSFVGAPTFSYQLRLASSGTKVKIEKISLVK